MPRRLRRRLPAIVRDIRSTIQSASPRQSLIRQLQQAVSELEQTANAAQSPSNATPVTIVESVDVQQQMMAGARRAGGFVMEAILLLFLIYFLLATGDVFKRKFVKLSGDRFSQRKVTQQMIDEITTKIGRYVFYMFWSGALVGTATWLAFWWLGVRYAGLWGVAAGLLNCIPYFGPTAVMVGSAVAALVQFNAITMVAAVAGTSVAITSLEGYLLTPIVLGQRGESELRRGVRLGDVLGLDVGRARHAARRSHRDDDQDGRRSRRVAVDSQRTPRRAIARDREPGPIGVRLHLRCRGNVDGNSYLATDPGSRIPAPGISPTSAISNGS